MSRLSCTILNIEIPPLRSQLKLCYMPDNPKLSEGAMVHQKYPDKLPLLNVYGHQDDSVHFNELS